MSLLDTHAYNTTTTSRLCHNEFAFYFFPPLLFASLFVARSSYNVLSAKWYVRASARRVRSLVRHAFAVRARVRAVCACINYQINQCNAEERVSLNRARANELQIAFVRAPRGHLHVRTIDRDGRACVCVYVCVCVCSIATVCGEVNKLCVCRRVQLRDDGWLCGTAGGDQRSGPGAPPPIRHMPNCVDKYTLLCIHNGEHSIMQNVCVLLAQRKPPQNSQSLINNMLACAR